MKKKILILILLVAFVISGIYFWWHQAIKPMDPSDSTQTTFIIKKGENVRLIAERLQKEGLLRSPIAFFLLARFGSLGNNIQAGSFRLTPSMDLFTLAQQLTHGTEDQKVTVIEGWRNEEIAMLLSRELNIPETEFLKTAKIGFMFPDTYLIPKESTADSVVKMFTDNFNKKITPDLISKARKKNLSLNDLVTIASMLEREAKTDKDRPLVASVILNRLKIGMKLDIDATVQYALGYQPNDKTWWKKELTEDDLNIESPYNTYLNQGLPPTPISNPGLAVISAVLDAPETDYLYYVSDNKGNTHFAASIDEHNSNIQKYIIK